MESHFDDFRLCSEWFITSGMETRTSVVISPSSSTNLPKRTPYYTNSASQSMLNLNLEL